MSHSVSRPRYPRIFFRIVVPFFFLFALTTALSWLFSAYLISHHLDNNLQRQMQKVVNVLSGSPFALNPQILHQLKDIVEADIVFSTPDGEIIRSTLSYGDDPARIARNFIQKHSSGEFFRLPLGGLTYRALSQAVEIADLGPARISLMVSEAQLNQLKSRIFFSTGLIAAAGLVALTLAGLLVARSITRPVEKLANAVRHAASGDRSERVAVGGNHEIAHLAASFNDMMDQMLDYEKKLVESEKMATAGQMAAGFAHEVRNPLTSVKMMCQVLQSRMPDHSNSRQILSSMEREISRLDRIIKEMLSRTQTLELCPTEANLNQLVREVVELAEQNLNHQSIHLNLNLLPGLADRFFDTEKMKQVLWNLILNARDAMPGGGQINISTDSDGDGALRLRIDDSGEGIDELHFTSLFKPFYTTKPEGLGLGLSTSKKIVEAHHGTLHLSNLPEGGARAEIILPVHQNSEASDQPEASPGV